MTTTSNELVDFVKKNIGHKKFIIAFHREPFTHIKTPKGIKLEKNAAGGGIELLMGILKQIGGTMVSVATGDADKAAVDAHNRVEIKTDKKNYLLRRIFVSKKVFNGFYLGFANQVLWPLCHAVFVKPIYNPAWWEDYIKVNEKFCEAILEEVGDDEAFIWINDYQLALLPQMLHKKKPSLAIGTFWHIPWPAYALFRTLPWRKEILKGLLGSDFISFHRDYMVENFVDCVRREVGVIVDTEPRTIGYENHETKLINLPAGIDDDEIHTILREDKKITKKIIKQDFGVSKYDYLAFGVDRIDYTKGLLERVRIIDRFLELHPEFIGKFVYLSVAPMSRTQIPAYKQYYREL